MSFKSLINSIVSVLAKWHSCFFSFYVRILCTCNAKVDYNPSLLCAPRCANYCDQLVCMSVCLFFCLFICLSTYYGNVKNGHFNYFSVTVAWWLSGRALDLSK